LDVDGSQLGVVIIGSLFTIQVLCCGWYGNRKYLDWGDLNGES